MSSVVYSLKNGINRANNPTIGGVFAYGSYTSAGVFTLFTDYEYEDGTAFVSEPFDDTQPLVWKGSTQYPHLGFENLTPNLAITPQPFPSFGIYLHPYFEGGERKDVGVRVTIPFGGNIAIASIIQRADLECGDDIGYRIMKNGVAIQSRQFIQPSSTPTSINTPANSFQAGDIIDFIVDIGSQNNSYCDDTALEVTLSYQYTQIPTPVVETTPILCSTTTISGTTAYVSEGTFASIYDGTTLLYSTAVVLNPVLLNGTFSFTGLDFTNSSGKSLSIILEKSGDINSIPVTFLVKDGGCVSTELSAPIITEIEFCHKKHIVNRAMSGTSTVAGDVAVFEYPYNYGDPIVASGVSDAENFFVNSPDFKEGKKYVAFLVSYNGVLGTIIDIGSLGCNTDSVYVPTVKGNVAGVTNGLIKIFIDSVNEDLLSPFCGIIRDGKFDLKMPLTTGVNYIFMAVKIN